MSQAKTPIVRNIKIKSYRRFKNFNGVAKDFCKFNLMYGWNYSGKTTLSKIFANFNGKPTNQSDVVEGEYSLIGRVNNVILTQADTEKLRVHAYNYDYVKKNLFFETNSTTNIIIATEEAVEKVAKIKQLEVQKEAINQNITDAQKQETYYKDEYNNIRTKYACYTKEKLDNQNFTAANIQAVENVLDKQNLSSYIINDENKITASSKTLKNPTSFSEQQMISIGPYAQTSEFEKFITQQVTPSTVLKTLQEKNADNWVKQGIEVHKDETTCLFCGGTISTSRIDEIDKIFSSEFDMLRTQLESLLSKYNEINVELPSANEIIEEFREEFIQKDGAFKKEKEKFNHRIVALKQIINAKLKRMDISLQSKIALNADNINIVITEINGIINKHNTFVRDVDTKKNELRKSIKEHYIASMLLDKNYDQAIKLSGEGQTAHNNARKELQEKLKEIEEKNAEISSVHKGADEINKNLSLLFLGQPTVILKVEKDEEDKDITRLYRGDDIANDLSEGEKTSIAFAHFLTTLNESISTSKAQDEVLFIDDPISSLDHNHIYSISVLLKDLRDKFNQTFVTTHNFELYRLLSIPANTKEKTAPDGTIILPRDRFYYVKRAKDTSEICEVPKSLIEFKTEYNFLFANLHEFKTTPNEDNIFLVAHCARRFLEIYLHNKYPSTKKIDQKLDDLAADNGKNKTELAILYKIVNDESHTHSERSFDKSYLESTINTLFSTLENIDKPHYNCLIGSCN